MAKTGTGEVDAADMGPTVVVDDYNEDDDGQAVQENPLNANPNNVVPGGRYRVGGKWVNAAGEVVEGPAGAKKSPQRAGGSPEADAAKSDGLKQPEAPVLLDEKADGTQGAGAPR